MLVLRQHCRSRLLSPTLNAWVAVSRVTYQCKKIRNGFRADTKFFKDGFINLIADLLIVHIALIGGVTATGDPAAAPVFKADPMNITLVVETGRRRPAVGGGGPEQLGDPLLVAVLTARNAVVVALLVWAIVALVRISRIARIERKPS